MGDAYRRGSQLGCHRSVASWEHFRFSKSKIGGLPGEVPGRPPSLSLLSIPLDCASSLGVQSLDDSGFLSMGLVAVSGAGVLLAGGGPDIQSLKRLYPVQMPYPRAIRSGEL